MKISNKPFDIVSKNYHLSNSCVPDTTEIKDLDIIFNTQLDFSNHITSLIKRSKQRLFLLYKCFLTKDPAALVLAYKAYELPLFDYCSQIWSPHEITDIKRIESVQRLFTKRLSGYSFLSYDQRLIKAGLCSLELRRLRCDLIFCFKILHGYVKWTIAPCFQLLILLRHVDILGNYNLLNPI